jgi:hypothetical protein
MKRAVKSRLGQWISRRVATSSIRFRYQQQLVIDRQFDALTSDLSSHTGDFGAYRAQKSGVPDHKMIVI